MSDQELGKKLVEEAELEPFLDEYEALTGATLRLVGSGERPDFVCTRGNEPPLGLELVRVMHDPESVLWRAILDKDDYIDALDTAVLLQELCHRKESKRAAAGWRYPDRTVLLLQVMDAPLDEVARHLDDQLIEEMAETGFLEIWAADYTLLEPYATVQLFGIKPPRWRGLHPHRFQGMKPYG